MFTEHKINLLLFSIIVEDVIIIIISGGSWINVPWSSLEIGWQSIFGASSVLKSSNACDMHSSNLCSRGSRRGMSGGR